MELFIQKSMRYTAKLDGQTLRTVMFVCSLLVFSLIAGAPIAGGGHGG